MSPQRMFLVLIGAIALLIAIPMIATAFSDPPENPFAPMTSGGDSGPTPHALIIKQEDQIINNSSTPAPDDELFFEAKANGIYLIEARLAVDSTTDAGFRYQWTVPSGSTLRRVSETWSGSGSQSIGTGAVGVTWSSNAPRAVAFYAYVLTGDTPGEIRLNIAQNVATEVDTTLLRGSTLIAWEG